LSDEVERSHRPLTGREPVSRRPSALRRLGALLAPDGPPADLGAADLTEGLLALAQDHGLLPAVRSALAAADQPTGDRLRTAHVRNLARNLALVDEVTVLLAALDDAGLPAAPLKGIDAVLEDLYPDWGARTMADLDVLVEPTAGPAAAAVLADLGYEPVDDELWGHHHLTPMAAPRRVGVVEIHIGLQDRPTPMLDPREVLGRATRRPDRPGLRLDRTDAATHLIDHAQHAAGARRVVLDLRALHETALVIQRVAEVDWDAVRDQFAGAGYLERFDAHLAATAELLEVEPPVAPGRAGRLVARRELFVDDHPVVALLDRPGRRVARLRRARLERYYGVPLEGAALWRARARYLGEVGAHRWSARRGPRGGPPAPTAATQEAVPPPP